MSAGCATPYVLPSGWQQSDIADGAITDIRLPALQNLPFRLSLPINRPTRPPPLILGFHGWGGSHEEFETHRQHGRQHGYIVASPMGYSGGGTGHASWNGAGTTRSPGPAGPICVDPNSTFSYMCYTQSCTGGCADSCWWTTCNDSVDFVRRLLAQLDAAICFDPTAVFATGESNGGIFTYELAASSLASSFAAFLPIIGSPHRGYNRPPSITPMPFFGIWGAIDTTVPAIANPQAPMHPGDPEVALDTAYAPAGGWLYVASIAVVRLWAASNGCDNAILSPPPCNSEACRVALAAGAQSCVGWTVGCDANATVIRCLHPGGHTVPVWAPQAHWAYMQQVMAREGGTRSSSTLSPPPPPPQRQYPSLPLPLPPPGAPLSTAPVAPLYLVIVVGTIVAFIVFALGVLFGKCQGRKGRQKVVTTATRSKPGAGMEMTSVAPDSGLKTGDGIVDGARVVD